MIIFVGGLIGAGKSTIARGLAGVLEVPYYDIDEVKKAVFRTDPDYDRNMREGIPFSDATRARVYDRVIADLGVMRQTADMVVVDETLHKRDLRRRLYGAARELFGDFLVIWVRADDAVVQARLMATKREGHILDDPLPMQEAFRRQFEDFNRSVIVCNNNGAAKDSIAMLQGLFRTVANLAARMPEGAEC